MTMRTNEKNLMGERERDGERKKHTLTNKQCKPVKGIWRQEAQIIKGKLCAHCTKAWRKKQTLENCSIVTNNEASERETEVTKNGTNGQNERVTVEFKWVCLSAGDFHIVNIMLSNSKSVNWKWGTEFYVLFLIVCRVKWTFFSLLFSRARFCCTTILVHDNRATIVWISEIVATLSSGKSGKGKIFSKCNAPQIGSQAIFVVTIKKEEKWEHNALTMKKHDEKWWGIKLK